MREDQERQQEGLPVTRAALRAEARAMVGAAGHRRLLGPRCRVGHPGGAGVWLPPEVGTRDPGLLADLVERALDGLDPTSDTEAPLAWVARSGDLVAGDGDLAWLRAARTAFGSHGLALPCFLVLGRHGYVDLLGGHGHQWSRVRASRAVPAPPSGART